MLMLDSLVKRFNDKAAVDTVSLALLAGERCCLLGNNGAGKTTLMRMIAGMARPTSGYVQVFGQDPISCPSVRRRLGYLSDKPFIYDKLTSREHFELHAALYSLSMSEVVQRGCDLLRVLSMDEVLDERAETFSFGMQKKLALTITLIHEPDLLVLDEPLNGLDPDSAVKMEDVLTQYTSENRSVIVSTHSVEFASRFATKIGIMREGTLSLRSAQEGTIDMLSLKSHLKAGTTSERSIERTEGTRA